MKREDLEKIATDAARKALEDALEEWYEPAERKPYTVTIYTSLNGATVTELHDGNGKPANINSRKGETVEYREVMPDEFTPGEKVLVRTSHIDSWQERKFVTTYGGKYICVNTFGDAASWNHCKRPEVEDVS